MQARKGNKLVLEIRGPGNGSSWTAYNSGDNKVRTSFTSKLLKVDGAQPPTEGRGPSIHGRRASKVAELSPLFLLLQPLCHHASYTPGGHVVGYCADVFRVKDSHCPWRAIYGMTKD